MKIGLEFLTDGKHKNIGKNYRGALSFQQASIFISKAIQNAKELVEDSRVLLFNKRYSRFLSLSILALEEIGKIGLILSIVTSSKTEIKQKWLNLYKHKEKNFTSLIPMLDEFREAISARDFSNSTNPEGYYSMVIDNIKMVSMYSGINLDGIPFTPDERISKELTQFFLDAAYKMAYTEYLYSNEKAMGIWH